MSGSHRYTQSVVNQIIKPHRTRGESKYMLEEIYISDICGDLENRDDSGRLISINPQRAWFDDGKFRFQFPSLWYQSNCNNKAIGLRGIKLQPECVAFLIKVHIMKRDSRTGEFSEFDTLDIYQQFLPETTIQEILSNIALYFLNWAVEYHPDEKLQLEWSYNAKRSQAKLSIWSRDQRYNPDTWQMFIDIDHEFESECGFLECFNTTDDYLRQIRKEFVFDNVWNRRSLFVHASFVTGTSFQVLGENGEWYHKPSKMYRFNGNSPDFYFELSYDGIHPQRHRFARFVIQLSYIFNDADYMAE